MGSSNHHITIVAGAKIEASLGYNVWVIMNNDAPYAATLHTFTAFSLFWLIVLVVKLHIDFKGPI